MHCLHALLCMRVNEPRLVPSWQVSFRAGEEIFVRGEVAKDLLFLVSGEVDVMSPVDEDVAVSRLSPSAETILHPDAATGDADRWRGSRGFGAPSPDDECVMTLGFAGCFGQSVFLGRRRTNTHRAHTR